MPAAAMAMPPNPRIAATNAKTKKTRAQVREFLARQNPGGRLITGDEVAAAVWSLIEHDENGTILELDGAGVTRVEGPIPVGSP